MAVSTVVRVYLSRRSTHHAKSFGSVRRSEGTSRASVRPVEALDTKSSRRFAGWQRQNRLRNRTSNAIGLPNGMPIQTAAAGGRRQPVLDDSALRQALLAHARAQAARSIIPSARPEDHTVNCIRATADAALAPAAACTIEASGTIRAKQPRLPRSSVEPARVTAEDGAVRRQQWSPRGTRAACPSATRDRRCWRCSQ